MTGRTGFRRAGSGNCRWGAGGGMGIRFCWAACSPCRLRAVNGAWNGGSGERRLCGTRACRYGLAGFVVTALVKVQFRAEGYNTFNQGPLTRRVSMRRIGTRQAVRLGR